MITRKYDAGRATRPIWDPPVGDFANIGLVRCDRALASGLKLRTMEQTVRDTLEWQMGRPAENQVLKTGLKAEREAELLKLLRGQEFPVPIP